MHVAIIIDNVHPKNQLYNFTLKWANVFLNTCMRLEHWKMHVIDTILIMIHDLLN